MIVCPNLAKRIPTVCGAQLIFSKTSACGIRFYMVLRRLYEFTWFLHGFYMVWVNMNSTSTSKTTQARPLAFTPGCPQASFAAAEQSLLRLGLSITLLSGKLLQMPFILDTLIWSMTYWWLEDQSFGILVASAESQLCKAEGYPKGTNSQSLILWVKWCKTMQENLCKHV